MTPSFPKSLPPLVDGDVYGQLKVTVDELVWCKKQSEEVNVLLQWWGDSETTILRPIDVSKFPESADENSSVTYEIQTNLQHFESYLKQCNKLSLLIIKSSSKEVVGHVEVDDLLNHITGIQYQEYFPIITSSGSRLGDLRVNFNFTMNPEPEESIAKKKKRSRKKNKPQSMLQLVEEGQKPKSVKNGCLTCSEHTKGSKKPTADSLRLKPPVNSPATLNTERSDTSDCVLLEMLEKGKKLRDAMVLSVLDDIDTVLDDDLDLKLDQPESNSKGYKALKKTKNGEIVTPHEEKLINDYLEGKNMKEEEEILVLNALHASEKQLTSTNNSKHHSQNVDPCCLMSKTSSTHLSLLNSQATNTDNTSSLSVQSNTMSGFDGSHWMNKVNCFRLTIDNLTLTKAGWKKIDQAADNKSKSGDSIPPPRATYFIECHLVEESPRSQSQVQQSKSSPLRFCSRRQIENVIYFCQSSAHTLRRTDELSCTTCLVCWRHLNQRVPALLGHFSLASLVSSLSADTTASVPVTADNGSVMAHLRLRLELGKDKLHFGRMLEDNQCEKSDGKKTVKESTVRFKEAPLEIEDLDDRDESDSCEVRSTLLNYDNIPVCSNCEQNLVLSNTDSVLCVSCTNLLGRRQPTIRDPDFKISIPKNFSSNEHRVHEFMIGIDTVKGFPLFAGINDELSCYVDYKFPEITSNLKAEMGRSETTSRVIECQVQPAFSSVQRHKLVLPVVLPLSPLLAACSPGVTLRLWLRYYKPTPRDHMVAMALLPMDELSLMELEYDKNPYKTAVIKVLELPLALVPSSVTAPYQQHRNSGSLRVSVTYSNLISSPAARPQSDATVDNLLTSLNTCSVAKPVFPHKSFDPEHLVEKEPRHFKPAFSNGSVCKDTHKESFKKSDQELSNEAKLSVKVSESKKTNQQNKSSDRNVTANDPEKINSTSSYDPTIKENFEMLAENLEKRFNQLQSDLLKERQTGLTEIDNIVTDSRRVNSLSNNSEEEFLAFKSSTSSMDSSPLILGPPAYFGDLQNTVVYSNTKKKFSYAQSEGSTSNTISGFFAEEKEEPNFNSNESMEKRENRKEPVNPKTFKVTVKIDRAVNLKAVKGPSNGKKCKVPPSTWVCFGSGGCCESNCGDLVCTGQKFSTPVIRRSHNPIWNLSWDVDLPLEYLQQVDKRLVFRVFEENLDTAFGLASANLSILTTGLPCLSSWLSINDLSGSCKGQIKIVVTPLEDLSKYQECSVYDPEEEEFEEMKNNSPDALPMDTKMTETTAFVASQTEVFVRENEISENLVKEDDSLKSSDLDEDIGREDPVLADDIISDYKNTLENNFRNEMAGLENLIKFLRVGSMSNEISFLRSNEDKENSNPTFLPTNTDSRTCSSQDISGRVSGRCSSSGNQSANPNGFKERILIDASTETMNREAMPSSSGPSSSEDILTKLLQQISMFQLPTVKIADNTSQTLKPETKESFTETVIENHSKPVQTKTIQLRDACTETEDLNNKEPSQPQPSGVNPHICGELGSVLQHFLTCRPAPIKTCDSSCQTTAADTFSSTNSSGLLARSLPSGMSSEIQEDNGTLSVKPTNSRADWISSEEAHSNCERLIAIDNNIKDLEKFLKENLMFAERNSLPSLDLKEESLCGSINGNVCSMQDFKTDNENSSSDVESLEHLTDGGDVTRETPDGGDNASDLTLNSDTDTNTATTMRRRGTFVIDKAKDHSEASHSNKN